ncbi:MAG: hypothetical protein ACO1SV_00110 [Fimbriimonas sp.]
MMLGTLALLTALQAEPRITLDAPIGSLDSIVRTVAERTGESLGVAPPLAREMVRVRVKDVPVPTLMKQLAYVAHADWIRDGNRLRLERSPGRERELRGAERAALVEAFRKEVERLRTRAATTPYNAKVAGQRLRDQVDAWAAKAKPDDPFANQIPIREMSKRRGLLEDHPAARAALRIGQCLNIETFIDLDFREGIVLSTHPRADEIPFSAAALAEVETFRKDMSAYSRALAGWSAESTVAVAEVPDRVTLTVHPAFRDPGRVSFSLVLTAYGANGREIATGSSFLTSRVSPLPPPPPKAKPFPLSPRSAAVEAAYMERDPDAKISPEVREILRHPDKFPHFAFGWSEVLPALAASPQANVVANLTDSVENAISLTSGAVDLAQSQRALLDRHTIEEEKGWFIVRPRHPGPAGLYRLDRRVDGALIRAVADDLPVSIEEVLGIPEYTRRNTRVHFHPLTSRLAPWDSPGLLALFNPQEALQILSTLSVPVRARLLQSGGEIGWRDLGPDLQSRLRGELLGAGRFAQVTFPQPAGQGGVEVDDGAAVAMGADTAHLAESITRSLFSDLEALGTPKVGDLLSSANLGRVRLQVVVNRLPGLVERRNGVRGLELLTAHQVDEGVIPPLVENEPMRVVIEDMDGGEVAKPKVRNFRPAQSRSVTLRLWLTDTACVEHTLQDWAFDPKAPFVPPGKIPPAVIREIQRIRDGDE